MLLLLQQYPYITVQYLYLTRLDVRVAQRFALIALLLHGSVVGRSIAEHERVVRLHSAVVNYDYLSGGRSRLPEIRFVSEMLECDLEVALVHGLPELNR